MGPTDKSFNQVKNILSKLDRNIDALRSKRTSPPAPVTPGPMHSSADSTRVTQASLATGGAGRPASAFGRATPIPPPA